MRRIILVCLTGWSSLATSASGQEQGKPDRSQAATDKSVNPLATLLPAAAGSLFQSAADLRAASESLDRFGNSLELAAAEIGGTLERTAQQLAQMSSGFDPFGFQHAFKTIGQQLEMIREQQATIERLQQDDIARLQQEIQQLKASNKTERNQPERRKSRRRQLRE